VARVPLKGDCHAYALENRNSLCYGATFRIGRAIRRLNLQVQGRRSICCRIIDNPGRRNLLPSDQGCRGPRLVSR